MYMLTLRLSRRAMACDFEIVLSGEDRRHLMDVATLALDEIERLDAQLSCFRPTSEVSFINAEAAHRSVVVEPGLFEILELAKEVWTLSGGAFDVTSGPIIELWREAEKTGNPPAQKAIDQALEKVGMGHVLLDERTNQVRFDIDGVSINLGAIGKGFAVRRAAEILRDYDVESALINGGGSTVYAIGDRIGDDGWNLGIRHPSNTDERVATVRLRDEAMSTSGGTEQRDKIVEERFEHIIDPVSGMPVDPKAVSVSVIAPDAALSDALSTAFYIKGHEFAEQYCRDHPTIIAMFVEKTAQAEQFQVVRIKNDQITRGDM